MLEPDEKRLLRRCAQGDETAFVQLVRRYRQMLASYIRSRIENPDDAEDVLQDTLIAAWIGVRQLRDPGSVRAWLMQVAHNRCRDYFRGKQRQDVPTEARELEAHADRFGMRRYRHARTVAEAVEALETVPAAEREAAKRFYLEGLSIAEIAAESQCPPGTIKRRLFQARNLLRQALDVPLRERSFEMEKQAGAAQEFAFPSQRPNIVITESDAPTFAVNCPELRWWAIIPRTGEQASWAAYNPPDWSLAEVAELRAVRPAKIHDIEGVEIEVRQWKPDSGWQTPWTVYGRLTEQKAQYLATIRSYEGAAVMQTFLDAEFGWDWGEMDRALEDKGHFAREADGTLKRVRSASGSEVNGAGVFTVEIGAKRSICLRVFELGEDVQDKTAQLIESYLTREGRTLLTRHYCRPEFADVAHFEVVVEETERRVVDGVMFVHWYDTITNSAL